MNKLYPWLLGGALLLAGCNTSTKQPEQATAPPADNAATPPAAAADTTAFNIQLSPQPPKDLSLGATPQQLAGFAWSEFFALNWQASYPKSHRRDDPDPNWSFRSPGASPALAVWETFAHRTELRPASDKMQPFDAAPLYSFGKPLAAYPGSGASFTLFDNLDENNEIGSCDVYGRINEPDGKRMVLYQAKVNRYEYEYIRRNFNTNAKLKAATAAQAASIKADTAYYQGGRGKSTCQCPPGVVCLPCGDSTVPGRPGTGTIEIKSAWRQLTKADDASKFFTRKVIYYRQAKNSKGVLTTYYDNATFALIGLHIIHKTVNYPAFVFATWEHVDVEKDGMGLALLDSVGKEIPPVHAYPRLNPITAVANQATAAAHRQLRAQNPQSVWLNYRLVGVQGTPTNDSTAINFFLANYVVESDRTLADFHGSGIGTPHNHKANTLYLGNMLSVGGCQGCHGASQVSNGTDFSFLLDQFGKPVVAPDIDETAKGKLLRSIRATARR